MAGWSADRLRRRTVSAVGRGAGPALGRPPRSGWRVAPLPSAAPKPEGSSAGSPYRDGREPPIRPGSPTHSDLLGLPEAVSKPRACETAWPAHDTRALGRTAASRQEFVQSGSAHPLIPPHESRRTWREWRAADSRDPPAAASEGASRQGTRLRIRRRPPLGGEQEPVVAAQAASGLHAKLALQSGDHKQYNSVRGDRDSSG